MFMIIYDFVSLKPNKALFKPFVWCWFRIQAIVSKLQKSFLTKVCFWNHFWFCCKFSLRLIIRFKDQKFTFNSIQLTHNKNVGLHFFLAKTIAFCENISKRFLTSKSNILYFTQYIKFFIIKDDKNQRWNYWASAASKKCNNMYHQNLFSYILK